MVIAGLSLAGYALTAFTTRDWTVAGPGLLVAAAGVAGLRMRWLHLAGLVPGGAILSIAGPILAYDLARPDETPYFVGTVLVVVGGCLAAVFGTASTLTSSRRALPAVSILAAAAIPLVVVHLRNTGALPHDFTIEALDVAVFVPSGRDTYLRLPASDSTTRQLICTVGDHLDLSMRLDLD